jgi:flagellum-specific ATP synthase
MAGRAFLRMLATYKRVEDMVNIGAYQAGANPEIDQALQMIGPIRAYLQQQVNEPETLEGSFAALQAMMDGMA